VGVGENNRHQTGYQCHPVVVPAVVVHLKEKHYKNKIS
jgi:hypothetical protein